MSHEKNINYITAHSLHLTCDQMDIYAFPYIMKAFQFYSRGEISIVRSPTYNIFEH